MWQLNGCLHYTSFLAGSNRARGHPHISWAFHNTGIKEKDTQTARTREVVLLTSMPSSGSRCSTACPMHTGPGVALCWPQGGQKGRTGTHMHDAPAGEAPGRGRSHCKELVLERNKQGAGRRVMEQQPPASHRSGTTILQGVLPALQQRSVFKHTHRLLCPAFAHKCVHIYKVQLQTGCTTHWGGSSVLPML